MHGTKHCQKSGNTPRINFNNSAKVINEVDDSCYSCFDCKEVVCSVIDNQRRRSEATRQGFKMDKHLARQATQPHH